MSMNVPERELTDHERASRARFAELCGKPASRWHVVRKLPPDFTGALDFADATSSGCWFGQCWQNPDGTWAQEPLGERPVLLAFVQLAFESA